MIQVKKYLIVFLAIIFFPCCSNAQPSKSDNKILIVYLSRYK